MSSKVLKAQFNKKCIAGLKLDMDFCALYGGFNGLSVIEILPSGINIQPGPGNPLYLNTLNIKGPMHSNSSIPFDFLPGISNITPRKTIDFPFLESATQIAIASGAIAVLQGLAWLSITTAKIFT